MAGIKLSNVLNSLVILGIFVGLFVGIYNNLETNYLITKGATDDEGDNVMDKLNDLALVQGMLDLVDGIHRLSNPGNIIDILGGLLSAGLGIIKIMTGSLTVIPTVLGIITDFYTIPSELEVGLGAMFIITMSFILLNSYTGRNE